MKDFDKRFEEFVDSVDFDCEHDKQHRDRLERELRLRYQPSAFGPIRSLPPAVKFAAAAVLVAALLITSVLVFSSLKYADDSGDFARGDMDNNTNADSNTREADPDDGRELLREFQRLVAAGDRGDLKVVTEFLNSSENVLQTAAASYLVQIGGERSLEILENYIVDHAITDQDNVFVEAARRIREQMAPEEGADASNATANMPGENHATQPGYKINRDEGDAPSQTKDEQKAHKEVKQNVRHNVSVAGYVFDLQGDPAAGQSVYLYPAQDLKDDNSRHTNTMPADPNGFYSFDGLNSMPYYVGTQNYSYQSGPGMAQLIYPLPDTEVQLDFGIGPVIAGQVVLGPQPLSKADLLLSSSYDPARSAFIEKRFADADGLFEFYSVPPGQYGIYCSLDTVDYPIKIGQLQVGNEDYIDAGVIGDDFAPVSLNIKPALDGENLLEYKIEVREKQDQAPSLLLGQRVGFIDQLDNTAGLQSGTSGAVLERSTVQPNGQHTGPASSWEISMLPRGEYGLLIQAPDGLKFIQPINVKQPGRPIDIDFEMPVLNCAVSGSLYESSCRELIIYNTDKTVVKEFDVEADGRFFVDSLPPGVYFINTPEMLERTIIARVGLNPGLTTELDINGDSLYGLSCEPLRKVEFDLYDRANGLPVIDYQLDLSGELDGYEALTVRGFRTFYALEAGEYKYRCRADGYDTYRGSFTVNGNMDGGYQDKVFRINVWLEPTGSASGK